MCARPLDYAGPTTPPRPILLGRLAIMSAVLGLLIFSAGLYLYISADLMHPQWQPIQVACAWSALFLNIFATTTAIVALGRDRRGGPQVVALILAIIHWLVLGAVLWHDQFN